MNTLALVLLILLVITCLISISIIKNLLTDLNEVRVEYLEHVKLCKEYTAQEVKRALEKIKEN